MTFLKNSHISKAQLKNIIKEHASWLVSSGAMGEIANLEGANLVEASLEGARLGRAYLREANLESANLREANLEGANLWGACLKGANLEGANLEDANLESANLESANLREANLRGVRYNEGTQWPENFDYKNSGAIGPGANLEGANLEGANLESANLREANLEGANLWGACLEGANLWGARLKGANLEGANLEDANLERANLEGANLRGVRYDEGTQWPENFDYKNSGAIGPGANLKGANLEGANLWGARLKGANLEGANLKGANLEGANLREARLEGANLKGANLEGARLLGANLWGARLERANLEGANLEGARLEGARLEGANLREARLEGANLREARLERANLREARLEGANLEKANLEGARLERANLREARLEGANLEGANLEGANLREARFQNASLKDANLAGTRLERANFEGANLLRACLEGANLEGTTLEANLAGVDLRGARYDENTRWPENFKYERCGAVGPGADSKGANLVGANLTEAHLEGANFEGAYLRGARLERAKLEDTNLEGANLESAELEGANLRGARLERANLRGARLEGANLERANLEGANLEGARLEGADLREARLEGANLERANLREARLEGANLEGANFEGARYNEETQWPENFDYKDSGAIGPGANLEGSNLRGAYLREARLEGANLREARLERANLEGANLRGARLEGANLEGANLEGANLEGANLREARLEGANLEGARLESANLEGANLEGANLEGARLESANLREANLEGANLWNARLKGANLEGANLEGANLKGARLESANLEGANLEKANLSGARYDEHTQWSDSFALDALVEKEPDTNYDVSTNEGKEKDMSMQSYKVFPPPFGELALPEGAELKERLPGFVIVEATAAAASELKKQYPVQELKQPAQESGPPSIALAAMNAGEERPAPRGRRYCSLAFQGPILEKTRDELEALGVEMVEAKGAREMVVAVPSKKVHGKLTRMLKGKAEVKEHTPKLDLSPNAFEGFTESPVSGEEGSMSEALKKAAHNFNQGEEKQKASKASAPGVFIANFLTSKDLNNAIKKLKKGKLIEIISVQKPKRLIVKLASGPEQLMEALTGLLDLLGLESLEEKSINSIFNNIAREIIGQDLVTGNPHPELHLDGEGEVIAVADTGLDTGVKETLHLDFQEQILELQSFPIAPSFSALVTNPGGDDGPADRFSGHGTHVAGSALGSGTQSDALGLQDNIQGVAPRAKLIFQAIEQTPQWTMQSRLQFYLRKERPPASGLYGIPDDLKELFQKAYDKNARIHSNSWGGGEAGKYDSQCKDLDDFVWQHKDFLVLVAAGNSGRDTEAPRGKVDLGSVDSPGVAKNCLTVGACENPRPGEFPNERYGGWWPKDFPRDDLGNDRMADNVEHIAAFSSRGPCTTGRSKPDVIAPGTFVLSTRSSQMPRNNFAWAPYNRAKDYYMFMGGTSMATPLVAGAAALVRQHLRKKEGIPSPSAALLKAALIHSALYVPYVYANPSQGQWRDDEQGWGRVYLPTILAPSKPTQVFFIDEKAGIGAGEFKDYSFELADLSVPLRVTLVYSDYPGEHLVNNLNLFVYGADNSAHVGNDFGRQNAPDDTNNVEGVHIAEGALGEGNWVIRVVGADVPQGPQDFALVVSGGIKGELSRG